MNFIKNIVSDFKIPLVVTLIYGIITLFCVINHEITCDEVQVWQVCKYLNFFELIHHLHNEGHPFFFYLIVMPFAKIFPDVIYMQIICWLASCAAVFILFSYSPFKMYAKFGIILSAGFIYFFPVVARSYSIFPMLIFLAAILYLRQKQHPILYALVLFMTANTHVIMTGFVFILLILFAVKTLKEDKKNLSYIISAVIMLLGLIFVVLQLHDTTGSNIFISFRWNAFLSNIKQVLINFFINAYNYKIYEGTKPLFLFDIAVISAIVVNFILIYINLLLNNKRIFSIGFFAILFQLAIYVAVYQLILVTRILSAYLIIVFCFWILLKENSINEKYKICSEKAINIMLTIMFILTSFNGFQYYMQEIKHENHKKKITAEFILKNIDTNSIILTEREYNVIALISYLKGKYKVYSVIRNKELNFVIWDKISLQALTPNNWIACASYYKSVNPAKNIYILIPNNIGNHKDFDKESFQLIFPDINTENIDSYYRIYKFVN